MAADLRARSPEEVFEDHLHLSTQHRFEDDIERNISPECVVLERYQRLRTPTRTGWSKDGPRSWSGRRKPSTPECVMGLTRS